MQSNRLNKALGTLKCRTIAVAAILIMIPLVASGCILPKKHPDKQSTIQKGKKKK